MKNKEKYNLSHLHIVERAETNILGINMAYVEIEYKGKIVKEYACTNEAGIKKFLEWLEEEYKPEILTDKEKAYLSAVFKPFRERIKCVRKIVFKRAFIKIFLEDEAVALPYFEKDIMYTGMEEGREYTLEELGL